MTKPELTVPRIEVHRNVTVLPQRHYWSGSEAIERDSLGRTRSSFDGGVFDSQRNFLDLSRHVGRVHIHNPRDVGLPTVARSLKGTWLYGGTLRQHFGHFVLECLGRLWAADPIHHGCALKGVVFSLFAGIPRKDPGFFEDHILIREATSASRRTYIQQIVELLTGHKILMIAGLPIQVEQIIIPEQIYGDKGFNTNYNNRAFQQFIQDKLFRIFGKRREDGRIYVSRSLLDKQTASPVLENLLEVNLTSSNYTIMHPEKIPVMEQMEQYYHSGTILGTSGSALHLAAICAAANSRFGVVGRQSTLQRKFSSQAKDMGVKQADDFVSPSGQIYPYGLDGQRIPHWQANNQTIVLDVERLWDQLYQRGYVDHLIPPLRHNEAISSHYVNKAINRMKREHPHYDFRCEGIVPPR